MDRYENLHSHSEDENLNDYLSQPPKTKKQDGEDDESLENANPNDSRADEKVIVNEQVSNKTVNAPSQTAVNTSESTGSDEETIN